MVGRVKNIAKLHIPVLVLTSLMVGGAWAYVLLVPPMYEVTGSLLVHRPKVANPNQISEDTRNRWVWVRDGLGLKESLLGDSSWLHAFQQEGPLKERYNAFLKKNADSISKSKRLGVSEQDLQLEFAQHLMKQVWVDYTGGDSNSYVFRVRDRDPQFAKSLVNALIDRAKWKAIQDNQEAYKASLASIQESISKTIDPELLTHLKHTEKQLQVASLLFDSSTGQRIEVTKIPHIPLAPIWPRTKMILLVAGLLGLALGLIAEYVVAFVTRSHATS